MPNRMLRDWTDSLKLDGISADVERLFTRLIMKADDYGRFHADPRLIKAACFPLVDTLRPNDLSRWLDELSHRQLILRYEADGRSLLAIVNYGQRLKSSRAKFPPLPGHPVEWLPTSDAFRDVPGTSRKIPLEEKGRETEVEGETEPEPEVEVETKPEGEKKPPNPQGGNVVGLADVIWKLCPRFGRERSSQDQLLASLKRLPADILSTPELILSSLNAWCASESWTREDGQFVPGIHRWVKDGKWRSIPEPAGPKKRRFAGTQEDIDLPM